MTLRNRRRSLALACICATTIVIFPAPAGAANFCRGQRATIIGTRGIDYIVGTNGPDVIMGLTGLDQIFGGGGADLVCGGKGDDFLIGGRGHDELHGDQGRDELFGEQGHDVLRTGLGRSGGMAGGPGNDELVGGTGFDTASFIDSDAAVEADLRDGTAVGEGVDRLEEIDAAIGSGFDDSLLGDEGDNVLVGGGGSDSLFSRGNGGVLGPSPATSGVDILVGDGGRQRIPGDDVLEGGPGLNVADFSSSGAPLHVDLAAGTAVGDGIDRLGDIQIVTGSIFNDTFVGDEANNAFRPFAGDDSVDGGDGVDTVVFSDAHQGVVVDLATGTATGEGSDSLTDLESSWGGPWRDQLLGDAGDNAFDGGRGNDSLVGNDGDDFLGGGAGRDQIDGGTGTDYCHGGETYIECEPHAPPTGPGRNTATTLLGRPWFALLPSSFRP